MGTFFFQVSQKAWAAGVKNNLKIRVFENPLGAMEYLHLMSRPIWVVTASLIIVESVYGKVVCILLQRRDVIISQNNKLLYGS